MPLYLFHCTNHGRIEVSLTERRPIYFCERCGQLCERVASVTRFGAGPVEAAADTGRELSVVSSSSAVRGIRHF